GASARYHARRPTGRTSPRSRAACMPEPNNSTPQTQPETAGRSGRGAMSNLTVRLLTAAVGIPIILWMLYVAPRWVFSSFATAVALIGGAELAKMTLKGQRPLQAWMILETMAVAAVLTFSDRADVLGAVPVGL